MSGAHPDPAPSEGAASERRARDRGERQHQRERIRRLQARRILFLASGVPAVVLLIGYSLSIGSADISAGEALRATLWRYVPGESGVSQRIETIVWVLRMPRVLVATLAGATLGMAGCAIQAVLKNPLATPYTLGVSAGAGFGAALGLILGMGFVPGTLAVVLNAFAMSLVPALVVLIAMKRVGIGGETIILCGVAMSYIFGAANTLLQFVAEDDALRTSVFWLVGDLTRAAMWQVPYLLLAAALFFVVSMYFAGDINLMKMGDDDAKGMGVDVERTKTVVIIVACLATATVISFTGSIGFVGLLAPHISRLIIGSDERHLIPASAIVGACLMLIADILAKSVVAPVLLPVGAITALLGGPLLIYLLLRTRSRRRAPDPAYPPA